jgi:hypothetical protein
MFGAAVLWLFMSQMVRRRAFNQAELTLRICLHDGYAGTYYDMHITDVWDVKNNNLKVDGLTKRLGIVFKDATIIDADLFYKNVKPAPRMYKTVSLRHIKTELAFREMQQQERDDMKFSEEELRQEQIAQARREAAKRLEDAEQERLYAEAMGEC